MSAIYELNIGLLAPMDGPKGLSCCRCLLFEVDDGFALLDCGFGIRELQEPERYIGADASTRWRIVPDPGLAALSQVLRAGLSSYDIRHIFCTHLDMDHAGGLVDFPRAAVHVSQREYESLVSGNPRYLKYQFEHGPRWVLYGGARSEVLRGITGWRLSDGDLSTWLIPLFGHTAGHCGVLLQDNGRTFLHCGDSYYRRTELAGGHPADSTFPSRTASDNAERLLVLDRLALLTQNAPELQLFCTHDCTEKSGVGDISSLGPANSPRARKNIER